MTRCLMTKSPRRVAQEALRLAKDVLPVYASRFSRQDYTQHPLFALLALKAFLNTDYRGVVAAVADSSDLRCDLGLRRVPHYSTLADAAARLLKRGISSPSCTAPPRPLRAAA